MRIHRLCDTVFLLVSLTTPGILCAQSVMGRVLDDLTAVPIATATVMLLDSTDTVVARAETDSVGRFSLQAPRTGLYRVYADRISYEETFTEHLPLRDAGSIELLVRLAPLPVELDGLVVEAEAERHRLRLENEGFYRRQKWSVGYFFDEEEVQKWHPMFVTDLLRQVPGLAVTRGRLGETAIHSRRLTLLSGPACPLKVVLDGFKVGMGGTDLDFLVNPERVIGMEIYPGTGGMGAPVQHRGRDARCGIVMIWTR